MRWEKQGLVYVPDGTMPWAQHYAFPPTPYFLDDETIRVFVAFCDADIVGRIAYVDVAADDPTRVLRVADRPCLDIGRPGAFDENGVVPTCVVPVGDLLYLYYVGFQLGHKLRYFQFLGLAVSDDRGESFRRITEVPVIDRCDGELVNRTSGFVLHEDGLFKLWYVGGSDWTEVDGKALPVYPIRYVESEDGKVWPRNGEIVVDFASDDEHALGRPWVTHDGDGYSMFFSSRTRSKGYRVGFALSADGKVWTRRDDVVGISVSESGWDSEMVAYASRVVWRDRTYLFYNGNACGRTGFGVAYLAEP